MLTDNPSLLLSIVNTKLRNKYSSLDELCEDLDDSRERIEKVLKSIGYEYTEKYNQFKLVD